MIRGKVKTRISTIFLCCILIFCCILGKLGYEQIFHHTDIMEKALSLWERDFTVAGLRGSILDKNGNVLAHDIPSTSVMVVPAQIQDADKTAQQLADVLQADKKKILSTITKHVSTQKLQPEGRLISDDKARKLEAMDLPVVYLVQDSLRILKASCLFRIPSVIIPTAIIWRRCWALPVSIIRGWQVWSCSIMIFCLRKAVL